MQDVSFYDPTTLSLLLQQDLGEGEEGVPVLAQAPLAALEGPGGLGPLEAGRNAGMLLAHNPHVYVYG